jgi:hypothetical protein
VATGHALDLRPCDWAGCARHRDGALAESVSWVDSMSGSQTVFTIDPATPRLLTRGTEATRASVEGLRIGQTSGGRRGLVHPVGERRAARARRRVRQRFGASVGVRHRPPIGRTQGRRGDGGSVACQTRRFKASTSASAACQARLWGGFESRRATVAKMRVRSSRRSSIPRESRAATVLGHDASS